MTDFPHDRALGMDPASALAHLIAAGEARRGWWLGRVAAMTRREAARHYATPVPTQDQNPIVTVRLSTLIAARDAICGETTAAPTPDPAQLSLLDTPLGATT